MLGPAPRRALRSIDSNWQRGRPLCLGQDPFANGRPSSGKRSIEQLPRRRFIEPPDVQPGKPRVIEEVLVPRPRRTQQANSAALEAPRDEAQHARARAVQPRKVVNDEKQGSIGGCLAKQHKAAFDTTSRLGGAPSPNAQRYVEGVPVDLRELGQLSQEWQEELGSDRRSSSRLRTRRRPHGGSAVPADRRVRLRAASRSSVLPTPGSPVTRRAPPPFRAAARNARTCSSSTSRPTSRPPGRPSSGRSSCCGTGVSIMGATHECGTRPVGRSLSAGIVAGQKRTGPRLESSDARRRFSPARTMAVPSHDRIADAERTISPQQRVGSAPRSH